MGTLSLVYLLVFLYPNSPHAHPLVHPADTAIALLFIVAAIKCLLCSTVWHTLSGCSTDGWHRRAACVDYVGISGLIAASVMGMEVSSNFVSRSGDGTDERELVLWVLLSNESRHLLHVLFCRPRCSRYDPSLGMFYTSTSLCMHTDIGVGGIATVVQPTKVQVVANHLLPRTRL